MSDIKTCFVSRWEDGFLVEIDFSQLEVIALAELTGDRQLIADLKSGQDMHIVRAAELFKYDPAQFEHMYKAGDPDYKRMRQLAKALSFQLQYGSGPTNMAKKNKIDINIAKRFIKQYYDRYPQVKQWQESVAAEVKRSRKLIPDARSEKGIPIGEGIHTSCTGRIYKFIEYDSFDEGQVSFSPTQIKNFPVQGFATGDIVPLVLGKVYRELQKSPFKDNFLMVNTIHDSILFDCKDVEIMLQAVPWVCKLMESAPKYLEQDFGVKMSLPLKVEAKYGKNWGEMRKYIDGVPF